MLADLPAFERLAAILGISALFGALATWLRQPLIVGFIAVGILVGPVGLELVTKDDVLGLLAKAGIAVLLFLVGLRLDLNVVRSVGPVALATGLGQVAFTSLIGFVICLGLGLPWLDALYAAVALTFSSTIIIVKLLSDKREIDALHGRIAVGFLIVQDLVVIVAMIALAAFGAGSGGAAAAEEGAAGFGAARMLIALGKGVALLLGVGLLMRFALPPLTRRLARAPEALTLFALAWAVGLYAICEIIGLSGEVGAFLAGCSLAGTPWRDAIGGRLTGVRDFLLLFFFVQLGASLDLSRLTAQVGAASALSLFVLIGNPLIVMAIMGAMGYRRRTGFLAGLTVAQISEFSLILAALGVAVDHISPDTLGLVTLVGIVTIGVSTYLILYSGPIYEAVAPYLGLFERAHPFREIQHVERGERDIDTIVLGLGRYGGNILRGLMARGRSVLGIDFDPEAVRHAQREGLAAQHGDAEDPEFALALPLASASLVICAVPHRSTNVAVLRHLRSAGYQGRVALTAHGLRDAALFESLDAEIVLLPFVDAANEAVDRLLGTADLPA
ncbi:MAG TPA: cation:proton antiporter [Phycisphaerales bacterium]|nr:cation:proton antiporter [Phycisphaerales bacterium]HMP36233.1 cation:proton antiporter [Phycisphaerales bacterium]